MVTKELLPTSLNEALIHIGNRLGKEDASQGEKTGGLKKNKASVDVLGQGQTKMLS